MGYGNIYVNMSELSYREMQEKATGYGMSRVVGVSKTKLVEFINDIESKGGLTANIKDTSTPDSGTQEVGVVVMDGPREVRRFTKESHGKGYRTKANQYVSKEGRETFRVNSLHSE